MADTGAKMDAETSEIAVFAGTLPVPTFAESRRWMVMAPAEFTMVEAGDFGRAADTATQQMNLMGTAVTTGFTAYKSLSKACATEYETNDTTEAAHIADAYVPDFLEPAVGGGH